MSQQIAPTVAQRETIYREKLNGHSLKEVAQEQHCSESCARKWWRIGCDHGVDGLHRTKHLRSAPEVPSSFDPLVAEHALSLKRQHPKRGARRTLQGLVDDLNLTGHTLPKRRSLTEFLRRACSELLHSYHHQPASPPQARHVHELWQMDGKRISCSKTIATVLDVRKPVACVFLASLAHAVQTEKHWRKLTLRETQGDLRALSTEF